MITYNADPLLMRCLRPQGFRLETESGSMRCNKEDDENYRAMLIGKSVVMGTHRSVRAFNMQPESVSSKTLKSRLWPIMKSSTFPQPPTGESVTRISI
jgi:hypothetical protein